MEPQLFHVVYIDDGEDSGRLLSADRIVRNFSLKLAPMFLSELLRHLQIPILFLSKLRLTKKKNSFRA
jgi:hypothetical protein